MIGANKLRSTWQALSPATRDSEAYGGGAATHEQRAKLALVGNTHLD